MILANENGQCLKISENAGKKLFFNEAIVAMNNKKS